MSKEVVIRLFLSGHLENIEQRVVVIRKDLVCVVLSSHPDNNKEPKVKLQDIFLTEGG